MDTTHERQLQPLPPPSILPEVVVKQWEHSIEVSMEDEDASATNDDIHKLWPPMPKASVIPDDWDCK